MTQKDSEESVTSSPGGLAGETVDAIEHMADSKAARKAEKKADKEDKKAMKQATKDAKKAVKKAYQTGEPSAGEITVTAEREQSKFTPKKARNAVGVAKVVGPALIPVVAPYAVRAAGLAREAYDRYQARRIGVAVDHLGEFTGRGAGLHARISGVAEGLADLRKSASVTEDDKRFIEQSEATLRQLTAAVRAAERMPSTRRKAAHKAAGSELDQIEEQLLKRLGV